MDEFNHLIYILIFSLTWGSNSPIISEPYYEEYLIEIGGEGDKI